MHQGIGNPLYSKLEPMNNTQSTDLDHAQNLVLALNSSMNFAAAR